MIEDELVAWINENGGWVMLHYLNNVSLTYNNFCVQVGLNIHVRPESRKFSVSDWSVVFIGCSIGIVAIFYLLKFIGFQIVPKIVFK